MMNLLSFYFVTYALVAVICMKKDISRTNYIIGIILIILFNIVFACLTVISFEPGDYSVYLRIIEGCSVSAEKCRMITPFEPIFTALIISLTAIMKTSSFKVWATIITINQIIITKAIDRFRSTYNIQKGRIISLLIIISIYSFTNFYTLAIRYSLSFSVFLLGMSYITGKNENRLKTRILSLALFASSSLIHYQSIFLMILPLAIMAPNLAIFRKIFPDFSNKMPSLCKNLFVKKQMLIFIIITLGIGSIVYISFSPIMVLLGKAVYLSGYTPGSLGLRALVETLLCTFLLVPPAKKLRTVENMTSYRLITISYYFLLYSMCLAYLSLLIFSIDGFSRQLQSAFIIMIISFFTVDKRKDSIYKLSFVAILVYSYLITAYTLVSNESFLG